MEFKVGDILEFKGVPTYAAKKGAIAICTGDNGYVQIEWIRNELSGDQADGGYHPAWFTKIGEVSIQKEDRIFEEIKKEKVMKYNFKEGKQRVIKMLEEHIFNFKTDMSQDIKIIINEEREDAIEQVEDIIESIRMNTNYCEKAIDKVEQASTVAEVLKAMYMTVYEEMEETVLSELFGLESVTRED
jgi:hypothetical protein